MNSFSLFQVPNKLSKPQIKNYLESLYEVNILQVHTANVRGKLKKGFHGIYKRPDYKKAYITVADKADGVKLSAVLPTVSAEAVTPAAL